MYFPRFCQFRKLEYLFMSLLNIDNNYIGVYSNVHSVTHMIFITFRHCLQCLLMPFPTCIMMEFLFIVLKKTLYLQSTGGTGTRRCSHDLYFVLTVCELVLPRQKPRRESYFQILMIILDNKMRRTDQNRRKYGNYIFRKGATS